MAREVGLEFFAAARSIATRRSTRREPEEYGAGHVPGARPAPPAAAPPHLPKRREVIRARGKLRRRAADRLTEAGLDALSVTGDTRGRAGAGRPVATGPTSGSA
ncbi:rhodanese-like domain-containing protein [Streptomyces sp. NPDC086080]|uniref:rhodanese-like domain-containing protein n=1 Tax=Streptomyces sp. NPDC086080 TaxID=3365748 RepID=UPI0037D54DDC